MPPQRSIQTAVRLAFQVAAAAVLFLTLSPVPEVPGVLGNDKLQHALAFAALALLGSLGWPRQMAAISLGLLFFGALIEGVQGLEVIGRERSLLDFAADAVGILTGTTIAALMRKRSPN